MQTKLAHNSYSPTPAMKAVLRSVAVLALLCWGDARADDAFHAPPGTYRTSWVGNTFGGDGGPNGFGYWVENGADEIAVTPGGTIITGLSWDEAGRCVGLHRDGRVNRVLVKHETKQETAWGWNTGNEAIAAEGEFIYVGNAGKRLLRFRWKTDDLDSVTFDRETELPSAPVGLAALGGSLAVVYPGKIELRHASDLMPENGFSVDGVSDAAFAPDGSIWVIAGKAVRHFSKTGAALEGEINGIWKPRAIAFDNQGRLIVCDDGPDQQVKFFDVREVPKLVATFGDKGGLLSGTPGQVAPKKLFALCGAGTDAVGNLYVAMSFGNGPAGNLIIRSFTPVGELRWENISTAFVDTFGFDPKSDGAVVVGRTAIFDLDLAQTNPGAEWKLRAITLDHVNHGDEDRIKNGKTALIRHLEGKRLLYQIGQYGGGYQLFTFDEPDGQMARMVGKVSAEGETWAWDVAPNGDIIHGDAKGRKIQRHRFGGWADGKPVYSDRDVDEWPWPEDFDNIRRVIYDERTDSLYLSGYLKGEDIDSWGVAGKTLRRYDGWVRGDKKERWTIKLPVNLKGNDQGQPLSPNGFALAGDYLFVGMVKPEDGKQQVHILSLQNGAYVGTFVPGPEVGGNAGWQDMPYAVAALKRTNGEYLVLVEEDWRGKNLLYRWTP
ncbi:MAG: hypothetical protein ABI680_20360 [Chthoniobacteraceae bacterium]